MTDGVPFNNLRMLVDDLCRRFLQQESPEVIEIPDSPPPVIEIPDSPPVIEIPDSPPATPQAMVVEDEVIDLTADDGPLTQDFCCNDEERETTAARENLPTVSMKD